MRVKKRLTYLWKFFKKEKNVYNFFTKILNTSEEQALEYTKIFLGLYTELKQFHKENYDLRFTQVIQIKIAYFPGFQFYMEDAEVLEKLNVPLRLLLYWGQNYDVNNNKLKKTKYILIKDLDTDHIEAILQNVKNINNVYKKTLTEELKLRKNE
jgi:hypothetical protein